MTEETKNIQHTEAEDADQSELSAFVEKARDSKHPEAILHIYANKSQIRDKFLAMLAKSEEQGVKIPDHIKKLLAFCCEYIFGSVIELLVTDKDEGQTQ